MTYKTKKQLDSKDWRILKELQNNARISYSELSKKVSLSRPAITERIKVLEECGVIDGYKANINYKMLGYPIAAYLKIAIIRGSYKALEDRILSESMVTECYRIAGDDDIIVKTVSTSVEDIAKLIDNVLIDFPNCKFVTFITMDSKTDFDILELESQKLIPI